MTIIQAYIYRTFLRAIRVNMMAPVNTIMNITQIAIGIAMGFGLDGRGIAVAFPARERYFLFSTASRLATKPTRPPTQWAPDAVSPWVKRRGPEADHSPPFSAEVKNVELYVHTPYFFMACCLII
jgi:hypothetical protein